MHPNSRGFEVREEPYHCLLCHFPGLTPDLYDCNDQVSVETLMLFGGQVRQKIFTEPYDDEGSYFLDMHNLLKNCLNFTASYKMTVSRQLYCNSAAMLSSKLLIKHSISHIGTSSYSVCNQFFVPGFEEPLYEETVQFVMVDTKMHKPIPLPQWHRDKYKGRTMMRPNFRYTPKPRPPHTVTSKVTVQWTDTDYYNHCTFSTYGRYAMDSIRSYLRLEKQRTRKAANSTPTSTSREGDEEANSPFGKQWQEDVLAGLTEEVVNRGVKEVEVGFLRECLIGDKLDIHLWQEEAGEIGKVICSMCRGDAEACQMSFQFFTE